MLKKSVKLCLLALVCLPAILVVGCGSNEVVKPDTFAPPPQESDESSSDQG